MIVWVLVTYIWGAGPRDSWHRSSPYIDEAACDRQAARFMGISEASHGMDKAYCEQVRIPARQAQAKKQP